MPQARKRLVSLVDTPYYHCISRCVRRAFLCGQDIDSGHNFEHRRQWIVDRIELLSSTFAIDVCAYAVMSNHYHVVLHIDSKRVESWGDKEVAKRWLRLFTGPACVRQWLAGDLLSPGQQVLIVDWLETTKNRLRDLSWFMRCLNEPIARMANAEDQCTGRFWEGRFKSQALLDEKALLCCMAYVDLNPIRAKLAMTPEASEFTSIQKRIQNSESTSLMNFSDCSNTQYEQQPTIPFALNDYLELVDWSGRIVVADQRGAIPVDIPPIVSRINLNQKMLIDYLKHKSDIPIRALGPIEALRALAQRCGLKFIHGVSHARQLYPIST